LIDNLATGVASTKEFLNAVTHQQVESTLALQESILSNAKSFKLLLTLQKNCWILLQNNFITWSGQCCQAPLQ
jgi:hypothetical protein